MSGQYSTNVKTQYFQPRTHLKNVITEFRLDAESAYFPNLRLSNIGTVVNTETDTPDLVGHLGCIRAIHLRDGATTISSTRHANRWLSFMSQRDSNQNNLCVHSPQSKAAVGFVLTERDKVENVRFDQADKHKSPTTYNELNTALLDLRKVFPILQSMSVLDTAMMPHLKVVIEWETDKRLITNSNLIGAYTVQEPELLADQIMSEKAIGVLRKSLKDVVWDEIESDQFVVPDQQTVSTALDGAVSKEQVVNAVVNGFDNKYVSRILMMKTYQDTDSPFTSNVADGYANYSSLNQLREKTQLRVNGSNLFAGDGLISDSQKAMLLYQSWGDVNIAPFTNRNNIGSTVSANGLINTSGVPPRNTSGGLKLGDTVGQSDYIGFSVEDKIRQLNFTYSRTIIKNNETQRRNELGLTVLIFAECRKSLQFQGGGYKISYL